MKVLFLDDNANRIRYAKQYFKDDELVIVETAAEAISKLDQSWDLVMLDHDLGGTAFEPSNENSGMEVVRYIIKVRPDIDKIIIHSWNNVAGPRMKEDLIKAGYSTTYSPFAVIQ